MHPYSVAKMVSSLAFMHGRRLFLNMLAGGFKRDLVALGDKTEHDDRYERTVEYSRIVLDLLRGDAPVSVSGRWYDVENLKLTPPVDEELFPGVLISGSSDAGLAAARAIGAVPVRYPKPPGEHEAMAARTTGCGSASSPATTPTRRGGSRSSASPRTARAR